MEFWFQLSNPKVNSIDSKEMNLSDALEELFPLHTESAMLIWKHVHIPLSYKYDISMIIVDVVDMLEAIVNSKSGNKYIYWPSNTFSAEWTLSWNENDIDITGRWHSVIGGIETTLNSVGNLTVSKFDFLGEWNSLLLSLIAFLRDNSYNEHELNDFKRMVQVSNEIKTTGILYR